MKFKICIILFAGIFLFFCKNDFDSAIGPLTAEENAWLWDADFNGEPDSLSKYLPGCSQPIKICIQKAMEIKYISQLPLIAAPVADSPSGTYFDTFSVKLRAGNNYIIRCEQEELLPFNQSPECKDPIPIKKSTVIKAKAFSHDNKISSITTRLDYRLKVSQPTADKKAGKYPIPIKVRLLTKTPGATIFYSRKGVLSDSSDGDEYSGNKPVSILGNGILSAMAFRDGWEKSDPMVMNYIISREGITDKPQFSPLPKRYHNPLKIHLFSNTPNAVIYYTLDGTEPGIKPGGGTHIYTDSIPISKSDTVKAVALADNLHQSGVSEAIYTLTPTAPAFFPKGLNTAYTAVQQVQIYVREPKGALVLYTTNTMIPEIGGEGIPYNNQPIDIDSTMTISAIAYLPGWEPTEVVKEKYIINLPGRTESPMITPNGGEHVNQALVTIYMPTQPDAKIYYVLGDSTVPTSSSLGYSKEFPISKTTTVRAIAIKTGLKKSHVSEAVFTIFAAAPDIQPQSEGPYTIPFSVSLKTSTPNSKIYYTTNGLNPTPDIWQEYAPTKQISISSNTTVKAVTVKDNMKNSKISSKTYIYYTGEKLQKPGIYPNGGTYKQNLWVGIVHPFNDAEIYYTLNGNAPTKNDSLYTGKIYIQSNALISARAFLDGYDSSDVVRVSYAITAKKLQLIQPNGAPLHLFSGSEYPITWMSEGDINKVKIQYSIGSDKFTIVDSTDNSHSFTWIVPDITTTNARIHIQEAGGIIKDSSDTPFIVEGPSLHLPTLSSLKIPGVSLSPPFRPEVLLYSTNVPDDMLSTTVTTTTSPANASLTINGDTAKSGVTSARIPLEIGENIIKIHVVAENSGSTSTYSVVLKRNQLTYPDKISVKVKLFDHYSAPIGASGYWEFNPRDWGTPFEKERKVTLGMVKTRLFNGLPVLAEDNFYNKNIYRWFTASELTGVDPTKLVPAFNDSISFVHLGDGLYEYNSQYFFPLDKFPNSLAGRGIESTFQGSDGYQHNFGFTMHISKSFEYRQSSSINRDFVFEGDDDVWVFIDSTLVLDLGGIHPKARGSFNLKRVADELGLVDGRSYQFDFFIAERSIHGSHCKITADYSTLREYP